MERPGEDEAGVARGAPAGGVVAALIAGVAIYGLAMGTTYPLLGILLSERVSASWNGVNAAATGVGLLVGVALVPTCSRRLGAGRTALLGVAVMALALAFLALAPGFRALLAGRLLLGVGANLLFVVAETALNRFAAPERRGRLMGLYSAAVAFGFVVGPAVVSAVPDRPLPLLLGCAAVTAAALLPLATARARLDGELEPSSALAMLPALRRLPAAFAFLFVGASVDAVVISLLPVIARADGHSLEQGALLVTLFHIGLLAGQPLVGLALDRLGRRASVVACCAASLACSVALALGLPAGLWPSGLVVLVWGGANYGLYTAGLALIGDRFAGAALSAATAALASVYALASVSSPMLAGLLLEGPGASGFYLATAAVYLLAALYGLAFFRPLEPTLRRCCGPAAP